MVNYDRVCLVWGCPQRMSVIFPLFLTPTPKAQMVKILEFLIGICSNYFLKNADVCILQTPPPSSWQMSAIGYLLPLKNCGRPLWKAPNFSISNFFPAKISQGRNGRLVIFLIINGFLSSNKFLKFNFLMISFFSTKVTQFIKEIDTLRT